MGLSAGYWVFVREREGVSRSSRWLSTDVGERGRFPSLSKMASRTSVRSPWRRRIVDPLVC
jgi:hypothetical protein